MNVGFDEKFWKLFWKTGSWQSNRKWKFIETTTVSHHTAHMPGSSGEWQEYDQSPCFQPICTASRHFLQNCERQEETWGMMQEQIYSPHRQQPPGTKSFYLLEPSKEESFRSRCSLNLPQASLRSAGTRGQEGKRILFSTSVPSSLLRLQKN